MTSEDSIPMESQASPGQTVARVEEALEKNNQEAAIPGHDRRLEQAEARTKQAELRTLKAENREQGMRASELSYRWLFEAARDGILTLDVDTSRVTDVNPFLAELLGFSHGEMVGKTVGELSSFKDVVSNQTMLKRLQKNGYVRHEDLPLETRDGRHIAVESVRNVYPAGDCKVIQHNFRDITERKRAEAELRETFSTLHLFIDSVPHFIAFVDAEERYQLVNRNYVEWFEKPREQIIGRTLRELHRPATYESMTPHIRETMAGQSPVFESSMTGHDGKEYCFEVHYVPRRSPDGPVLGYFVLALDVTARKQAELAVRASEARLSRNEQVLQLFVEHSPAAIAMFDRDMRYLAASHRYRTDYRLKDPSLVGRSHYEIFPEMSEHWKTVHQRCLGGAVEKCDEERFLRADGFVEWVRWEIRPWHESNGEIGGIILFSEVITERKQAQAAVRESEQRYRTLVDCSPYCIHELDMQGRIASMNRAGLAMMGVAHEDAIRGTDYLACAVQSDGARIGRLLDRARQGEGSEFEFTAVNGRNFRSNFVPIKDAQGLTVRLMGITQDITERKRAEALLNGQRAVLEKVVTGTALTESLTALVHVVEAQSSDLLCSILLLDADGVHLRHGAAPSLPEAYTRAIDGVAIGAKVGSCGTAAFRREPVFVEDIASDPLWTDYKDVALPHGLRACWSTPIFDEQQRVLGTFAIYYRQPGRPTAQHLRLIDLATQTAAVAISRQRAVEELRMLSARLLRSQDEERRRIARELHDNTAQQLAALAMNLASLQKAVAGKSAAERTLADSCALTDRAAQEIRTLSYLLHPPALESVGLVAALQDYAGGLTKRSGVKIEVEADAKLGRLADDHELALFRVAQEALGNLFRHSGSGMAKIRLVRREQEIHLEVLDHGCGMTAEQLLGGGSAAGELGVGIPGMRERLYQLGGRLEIDSNSSGTMVRAVLPVGEQL